MVIELLLLKPSFLFYNWIVFTAFKRNAGLITEYYFKCPTTKRDKYHVASGISSGRPADRRKQTQKTRRGRTQIKERNSWTVLPTMRFRCSSRNESALELLIYRDHQPRAKNISRSLQNKTIMLNTSIRNNRPFLK